MSIRCLGMFIKRVTLVNKYVFRPGFLHKSETYSWKVGLCSNLTFKSFSNLLFSMLVLSTFRFTFSVLLARKWYLSALLFRTIFSNHWNKEIEDSSRDSITSSKFFPETCGVLSPLKFAMLIAFNVKKNPLRYWITAFLKQIIVIFQIQF